MRANFSQPSLIANARPGFTYDFISPKNLHLPLATVRDQLLAPEGPAYKALIFNNQSRISEDIFEKIKEYSTAGLPIFFVGQFPRIAYGNGTEDSRNSNQSTETFANATDSVTFVNSETDLPKALYDQELIPRTSLSSSSQNVYNVRRDVSEQGLTYVWFYNDDNKAVNFQAKVKSLPRAKPYLLDSWTGQRVEVSSYRIEGELLVVDISLEAQDTVILVLECSDYAGSSVSDDGLPSLQTSIPRHDLSNGGQNSTIVPLKLWNIIISDWYGDYATQVVEPLTRQHVLFNQELLPWKDLRQDLANVSGVGTYTTTLAVPSSSLHVQNEIPSAVWLTLPPFSNTARAWINNKQLNPLNPSGGRVDISAYVRGYAESNLTIEVTTTLFNRVKADADKILQISSPVSLLNPAYSNTEPQNYGLLGNVTAEWLF